MSNLSISPILFPQGMGTRMKSQTLNLYREILLAKAFLKVLELISTNFLQEMMHPQIMRIIQELKIVKNKQADFLWNNKKMI